MMSLELDWIYKLADPAFALGVATPIIGVCSLATFLTIRCVADALKWRNRISFAAEVLVIFGVVGIFAFVGKARNDMLTVASAKEVKDTEYSYAVEVNRLKGAICTETTLDVEKTVAAGRQACQQFKDAQELFSHDSSLAFLVHDFQHISEIPNLPATKVLLFTEATKSLRAYLEATNTNALHEAKLREASARVSWHIALVIAIFVAMGVGFKCGRAAADLWPGRARRVH